MCNAWNHPPGCACGWGGDGWPVGYGGGGYGSGGYSSVRSTYEGYLFQFPFITYPSYVNPNAECPVCGASVWFYQSPYGGRVFFDALGPPWPKHPCTDNSEARHRSSPTQHQGRSVFAGNKVAAGLSSDNEDEIQQQPPKTVPLQQSVPNWVAVGWMPFVVTLIVPRSIGIEVEGNLFVSAEDEGIPFRILQTSPDAQYYRAKKDLWMGFSLVQNTSLIVSMLHECPILLKRQPDLQRLVLSSFILTRGGAVEEITFDVNGFELE